jgi:hypothetical protein
LLEILEERTARFETIDPNLDAFRVIMGFQQAKRLGIQVGEKPSNPLTNEHISSDIADIVYVIAPWPGLSDYGLGTAYGLEMGQSAGRIAKSTVGTEIYIASDNERSIQEFRRGVSISGHICVWNAASLSRYGSSDYTVISHASTCVVE